MIFQRDIVDEKVKNAQEHVIGLPEWVNHVDRRVKELNHFLDMIPHTMSYSGDLILVEMALFGFSRDGISVKDYGDEVIVKAKGKNIFHIGEDEITHDNVIVKHLALVPNIRLQSVSYYEATGLLQLLFRQVRLRFDKPVDLTISDDMVPSSNFFTIHNHELIRFGL